MFIDVMLCVLYLFLLKYLSQKKNLYKKCKYSQNRKLQSDLYIDLEYTRLLVSPVNQRTMYNLQFFVFQLLR